MIYTKPIDQITFEDVQRFCEESPRENIHLDYKEAIDTSLAKTIAAMANTWGGIILIGVAETDSKPALPIVGVASDEHLRERVNNLVLGNITPAVFPEVQVCPFDENRKVVIVVRVPQSNLTPHAIRGNTRVYLRTDTSNEPEELATVDRIAWLSERRDRSVELREDFYRQAEERFASLCAKAGLAIDHADVTLASSPRYPFEVLVDYRELRERIPHHARVRGPRGDEFPTLVHREEFVPIKNGTFAFHGNTSSRYVCYEEFNHHGFFYHREDMAKADRTHGGDVVQRAYLHSLMNKLDLYLESVEKLYERLGYWGLIELRIQLRKLEAVGFIDLPAPHGYSKFETIIKTPIDGSMEFTKTLQFAVLKERRPDLVAELLAEIAWALGFFFITADKVKVLLAEAGRA